MRKWITGWLALMILISVYAPAMAEKTITLTFTGDVTLGSEERNKEKPESFNGYVDREGYDWFFRNMTELFSSDDLTLVNLEGVLSDSWAMEDTSKTFRFRGPKHYVNILTRSSIEACAISNNHIMDFGSQGYNNTVATLQDAGVRVCGNEYTFVYEKDGIKIGFIALGNTFFYRLYAQTQEAIAQMRADGVSAIVCSFHAGQEYSPRRRDRDQEKMAQVAVEQWGADLVIMHHPHVVQGIEKLNNRYVFYSLGNFCFGGNAVIRGEWQKDILVRTLESMVVQADLTFSDEGEYLGQACRIYPCYISSSAKEVGDPNDFQPKFVYGLEAQGVLDRIQYDTKFDLGQIDGEKGYLELPYLENAVDSDLSAETEETVIKTK